MAQINIVNEQDEIIGSRERELPIEDNIYQIAALWIKNSKGQVLLAQRAFTKANGPGIWGSGVMGTVEVGEIYETNIIKEAEEELGITGVEFTKGPKEFIKGHTIYFCQWFFVTLDWEPSQFVLQVEEVAQVKWFDPKELMDQIRENPENFTYGMRLPSRWEILGLETF